MSVKTIPALDISKAHDTKRKFKLEIFYRVHISGSNNMLNECRSKIYSIDYYIDNIDDMCAYETYSNIVKYIQNTFPLLHIEYIDVYEILPNDYGSKYKNKLRYLMKILI